MKIPKRSLIVATLALVAASATGCAATGDVALEGTTSQLAPSQLTVAAIGDTPYNFDTTAGVTMFANLALQAVYDSLVVWNQDDNSFDPWLAESWEYLNESETQLVMNLRSDVTFIDGAPLNAEAVKASYDAMLTRDASPGSTQLNTYGTELTVIDEYTFQFDTTRAMQGDFFQNIAIFPIASPLALVDPDSLSTIPIGSGPYLLSEDSTFGVEMRYERNVDYWNADLFPYDKLIVKQFADPVAALNALRGGQVDAAPIDVSAAAEAESGGSAIHLGFGQYRTLVFGDRDGNVLSPIGDVRVRQAINMAFDRAGIAKTLDLGYGRVSSQPFAQGSEEYLRGKDDVYPYDLEAARALMADAGYADGFELTIPTSSATTPMEPIVQQSLADIGISVTYEPFPEPATLMQEAQSGRFPVIISTEWYVTTVPAFMVPGGAWAQAWGYQNSTIDELVDITRNGTLDERAEASQQIGQLVLEEAWFAPFSSRPSVWATDSEIAVKIGAITGTVNLPSFTPAN